MRRQRALLLGGVLLAVLALLACSNSGGTETVGSDATSTSTGSPPSSVGLEAFGPGDFILSDARFGLAALDGYRATLVRSFEGTKDGAAYSWTETSALVVSSQQRALNIESSAGEPDQRLVALVSGVVYERVSDGPCSATVADPQALPDPVPDPAELLPSVIGAQEAGTEEIGGRTSTRYTFDQRSLGLGDDVATATGSLWTAGDDGPVIRYESTTASSNGYFGDGVEGTLQLDYELTDVNASIPVQLPDDCPPGLLDIPTPPDATEVMSLPGDLSFETEASLDDVMSFYQEQLPPLGWTYVDPMADMPTELRDLLVTMPSSESQRSAQFTRGAEQLTVMAVAVDGITHVLAAL